uniref:Integrase catalytic domain-containing protein n=1 Tax=Tanacetum cinerariifolium TaxID=118510 RepID=A0A6L2MJY3_TANCI|nr:hypothetical protein [Tanacetum cinerariifolium]
MDHTNPTFAKISILDTGKFKQWKFRIQQYLQNEHYALWEVIKFGDSYKAPPEETRKGPASESSARKKGRTVAITTEDMQKRRNDVKERTTLLLALLNEHQLRFSKYETAKELWEAILKTFGRTEATKKTKKNQLKLQYGNFKAEGSETLEQTFNRLQAIMSHLEFMDVEIEQDDLNQKFLTSLAPEWLIRKGEVYTVSVPTASIQVSTASTDVAAASLSHDTICAYIATQSNGSQIKYEDINQIDEDDIEEIDIKWNMALLSMMADRFWKKTGLPEFVDDTVTDYSRPTHSIDASKCNKSELQSSNFSVFEHGESSEKGKTWPKDNFAHKSMTLGAVLLKHGTTPIVSNLQNNIDDKGYWDSGFSRHMTGNISYLSEYELYDGGYVSFGHGDGKITGKGIIKTGKLEFENVYFMKELKDFKLNNDTNVLLRTPRQHNMYSINLNNIVPHKTLTCLVSKALVDESMLWHRRLGHLNFKTMNKLVRNNLVKGLPSKCFENDHTCVACLKGKQHKASCKTKCDNGGEFKNHEMNEFCSKKGIRREFSNARTPQQNEVAERRNRTLIKAARTMLADAKLPVTFWAEAVNTACYVQNRVLVNKSQNKTPYELFNSRIPTIGFLRPFGCHVMILNTLDHLAKFDAKGDEGTSSTNISGTNDVASLAVKKDVSSLRYIALSNCRISNPTATLKVPSADQVEHAISLTVESDILTISSPVPTVCLDISPEISSGVTPIGTKWVLKNKKDEMGIVIRNKARLVAQGIPMDVKSAFLYGTIDEEVYVMHPPGFQDPEFPEKVYKVEKAMYGLHQAPRAWYVYVDDIIFGSSNPLLCKEFEALMHDKFQMSVMGELTFFLGLQVLQKKDGIFLSQDKYVGDILKKFGYSDVRSMIGSLMYLTASRPDIMFAVCTCARHQVTPKECHLHAVKRIFRYLKGHPKLGLWYPKEYPFDLVAYSDSDYGSATQDRKSTIKDCQFLGRRLISWQCKKQTIVATSTTEAEYVAAASGCGQVL